MLEKRPEEFRIMGIEGASDGAASLCTSSSCILSRSESVSDDRDD